MALYIFAMLPKILYNLTNLDIKKYSINDYIQFNKN